MGVQLRRTVNNGAEVPEVWQNIRGYTDRKSKSGKARATAKKENPRTRQPGGIHRKFFVQKEIICFYACP